MIRILYCSAWGLLLTPVLHAEPVVIPELQQVRDRNIDQMDLGRALEMLVSTLLETEDNAVRESLLRGVLLGLEGRKQIPAPRDWDRLSKDLSDSGSNGVKTLARELAQLFGDQAAVAEAFALLKNPRMATPERLRALASLLSQPHPDLFPVLRPLLDEPGMRTVVIRAYGSFDLPETPEILLPRLADFSIDDQRAVIETLATRESYARALLGALDSATISREAIPAYVDRSLGTLLGEKYTVKYGGIKLSEDKDAEIARYAKLANPSALARADASRGRLVFQKVCMACHKMYDEGGAMGPDLTGSNRADLNYLLLNILYPEFDVPDAYRMVVITTRDGQVLTGILAEENDQKIVLNAVGQSLTVAKTNLAKRETFPVSMMPPGLLLTLKEMEIVDLIKYFQTKTQVPLP